jgi:hypothetical protein
MFVMSRPEDPDPVGIPRRQCSARSYPVQRLGNLDGAKTVSAGKFSQIRGSPQTNTHPRALTLSSIS